MSKKSPDPIDVIVGQNIRRLRNVGGISQDALGKAVGITFQQVQKYERGANRISASRLVKIARVLGVRPADLLPGETDEPSQKTPVDLLTEQNAKLQRKLEAIQTFVTEELAA